MSFILDALKKSESDRQRQNGPALYEVRVAPPRTRLPMWAIAIALLLVVNLGIVIWILVHRASQKSEANVAATASPAPATAAAPTPAPTLAATPSPAPQAPPAAQSVPPTQAVQQPPPQPNSAPLNNSSFPVRANGAATQAADASSEAPNPADYSPAEEPAAAAGSPPPPLGSHVRRGTLDGVPLYEEAAATPGSRIPQLRLDLHVFAQSPPDRFVMINMHKLHEGDTTPEGVHVDHITPDGALLSYNGARFLLPRE
jgi:general secretion pathway protein B